MSAVLERRILVSRKIPVQAKRIQQRSASGKDLKLLPADAQKTMHGTEAGAFSVVARIPAALSKMQTEAAQSPAKQLTNAAARQITHGQIHSARLIQEKRIAPDFQPMQSGILPRK